MKTTKDLAQLMLETEQDIIRNSKRVLVFCGIVLVLSLILASCVPIPEGERVSSEGKNFNVVTIEGCEYIECDFGVLDHRVYTLTHKGNCKNTIHCETKYN